jgi:cyclic-di-GMP phosphodiesterase TipF (flagellum assembly factor)
MVLISVSIGAALFLGSGLSLTESMIVAIAALTALALYDAVAKQMRSRVLVDEQIANLSRGMADLARQVGDLARQIADLRRRLATAEQKSDPAVEKASAAIPAFAADIDELGLIVHQLAETVAAHQTTITGQNARAAEPVTQAVGAAPESEAAAQDDPAQRSDTRSETDAREMPAPAVAPAAAKILSPQEKVVVIRNILDAQRADLYLQPIVSLPQRRLRYYETFTRLRHEDGSLMMPGEFLAAAESSGLMPRVDHLVLSRAVLIVRRLLSKNRDIGLVCNISTRTLAEPQSSQQLLRLFEANQELVSTLVLELPQSFWRATGPLAQASLVALTKLGVRFSMDRINDLRMEPRELADRGIRLIKVPAKLLLTVSEARATDIHPADLSDLMARFGIGLIAEQIEDEATVADLLDLEVRLGQGFLFSPPRPVRPEVLHPAAENTAPERDQSAAQRPEAAARRPLATAVEEIRRAGMLRDPTPGGSNA